MQYINFIKEWPDPQAHLNHVALDVTSRSLRVKELVLRGRKHFPGMHPVSLSGHNLGLLNQEGYVVTFKTDGIRAIMTLLPRDNSIYLTTRTMNTYIIRGVTRAALFKQRTVRDHCYQLDGELMCYRIADHLGFMYIPHDTLIDAGQCVEPLEFRHRKNCLSALVPDDILSMTVESVNKTTFSVHGKAFLELSFLQSCKQLGVPSDGFIFQNMHSPYVRGTCETLLKWKPQSCNSVDFKLMVQFMNCSRARLQYLCCNGSVLHESCVSISDEKQRRRLRQLHDSIVECILLRNGQWKCIRQRKDKHSANSRYTYERVLESIQDSITFQQLIDSISK